MSKIAQIQTLVRNGLYYLTEHADDEAAADGFDIYDVEQGILAGKIRRTWPKEGKYEVIGSALDGRRIRDYLPYYSDRQSTCDYGVRRQTQAMKGKTMSFWEGETCEYCGGPIVEKRVTLHRKVRGGYFLIENVPTGVCAECGTRYYAANVLKTIAESLRRRRQAVREVVVPVYSL